MVESTHNSQTIENAVNKFTSTQQLSFDDLKLSLPEEQMKMAELRIPELHVFRVEAQEIME